MAVQVAISEEQLRKILEGKTVEVSSKPDGVLIKIALEEINPLEVNAMTLANAIFRAMDKQRSASIEGG